MSDSPAEVFDRRLLRRRRERAARQEPPLDYLARQASELLAERIGDVRRNFALGLAIGCHGQPLAPLIGPRIERLVAFDSGEALIRASGRDGVVGDEEALPFAAGRFDLVLGGPTFHWINDLPGTLVQIARTLRPDGLLLAAVPGGETLIELRETLLAAEIEVRGGAGLRVSPMIDVRDLGALLQRAGFALPVVDVETIRVTFESPLRLLGELRLMGQANALRERGRPLDRAVLARLVDLYARRFPAPGGRVVATFQFLMLAGWRPDPGQPVARPRGSGTISLARELGPAARRR
ncbi:MAG: methyltransferase domain-containing protein [Geminicoccaceae bacterium]|nr:methyltransferase domain-containing protein [Geminicoccaceae bacterium]